MFDAVHIHTATAHSKAYAVIARRGREYITLTGRMPPGSTSTSTALRAAADGVKAARTFFKSPILQRIIPITVHLPSKETAMAARGLPQSTPTAKEMRLMRLLAKASYVTNLTFTDKPAEENSALDMVCRQIAAEHAAQAPAL